MASKEEEWKRQLHYWGEGKGRMRRLRLAKGWGREGKERKRFGRGGSYFKFVPDLVDFF
jgi:hypothetical protein